MTIRLTLIALVFVASVASVTSTSSFGQPIDLSAQSQTPPEQVTVIKQPEDRLLLPEQLLNASATHFPDILASLAQESAARGEALSAKGAFDLVFNSEGYDRATGFWTGQIVKTEFQQALPTHGIRLYGGYRISNGTFPIYEDINFTNTGGEFKVGALFSLLQNRDIDSQRFRITDTQLAAEQARLNLMLTRVGVQSRAIGAYWRWVAAGQELQVYENLLNIALERETNLEKQIRQGAQADIALTENKQNLIRRQILVAEAKRNLVAAANTLSFYYRDHLGQTRLPTQDQLPTKQDLTGITIDDISGDSINSAVLLNRPELATLRVALERARNRIALSENALKPSLDFNLEVSTDFGAVAEGGVSRDSTDTVVGFTFSVPLQRRAAKGQLQKAEAERRALQLQQQQVADRIDIELNTILINLSTALGLIDLAKQDVAQSDAMVSAEQRRFELGASDFFLVNVREETAANARVRAIRAELEGRLARANYDAATMNTEALGLMN